MALIFVFLYVLLRFESRCSLNLSCRVLSDEANDFE